MNEYDKSGSMLKVSSTVSDIVSENLTNSVKFCTMRIRIPRNLFSQNLSQVVTTMRNKVNNIHSDMVGSNYSSRNAELKLATSDINSSFYSTKISQLQPSFSMIQITTVPTNTTTDTSLSRNMISAFTINTGNLLNQSHHNIMVAVLLGIFMCITLTITISIFVFCRKKNSVFMLQKCEQDSDLEMTDMNTEVETSDSEYEFIESSSTPDNTRRSLTCPDLNLYASAANIAEENHKQFDRHSKNSRSSNHRNKHSLSESPTSTPLLISNSNSQTGSSSRTLEAHSQKNSLRHSQSLDYVTEIGGAKKKTIEKSKKNKKEGKEPINSYQIKKTQEKISTKRKQKQTPDQHSTPKVRERKSADIFVTQTKSDKPKTHGSKHIKDDNRPEQETTKSLSSTSNKDRTKLRESRTDSGILQEVSVHEVGDSDLTEQSGLLDDISDADTKDINGRLEII